jgi:hypothetical protein
MIDTIKRMVIVHLHFDKETADWDTAFIPLHSRCREESVGIVRVAPYC